MSMRTCPLPGLPIVVAAATLASQALSEEISPHEVALDLLRSGGNLMLTRSANAPDGQFAPVGMTQGCVLKDGRGLDSFGAFQARYVGEFLGKEGVTIAKAYSSILCPAWDTARLISGDAPVEIAPALNRAERAELLTFKAVIAQAQRENPGANFLVVGDEETLSEFGILPNKDGLEIRSGRIYVFNRTLSDVSKGAYLVINIDVTVAGEEISFNGAADPR